MEQPVLSIRTNIKSRDVVALFKESYQNISEYILLNDELMTDAPFIIYNNYLCMDLENLDIEICFPVAISLPSFGRYTSRIIPKGKIIFSYFRGDIGEINPLYGSMTKWIADNGYEPEGPAYEYYFNDYSFPLKDQLIKVVIPLKENKL